MTDGEIHEQSLLLGSLKAGLENLTKMFEAQEQRASAGRQQLHGKVDDLRDQIAIQHAAFGKQMSELASRVDAALRDIADMKPLVRSHEVQRQRHAGMRWLINALWGALIAGIGAASSIVTQWLHVGAPRN